MRKLFGILIISSMSTMLLGGPAIKQEPKNEGKPNTPGGPEIAEVASIFKGVVKLHVSLGEYVKKGQLLFEVNTDMLQAQKEFDEANLKFMELVLKRAKKLISNNSISVDDVQQCERDLGVAEWNLKNTIKKIAASKYYAPFDGTVTKIIRYNGSGLGDNDDEVEVTAGKANVDTKNKVALVCTRWPGILDLKVKLGEKVKKGQLLFVSSTITDSGNEVTAQKKIDEFKLIYAKKYYDREKQLFNAKMAGNAIGSPVSYYDYYKSYIDYREAMKTVKIDELQIKQSSGYAPFDGEVTEIFRYSKSGNGAGKPVLNLTASE